MSHTIPPLQRRSRKWWDKCGLCSVGHNKHKQCHDINTTLTFSHHLIAKRFEVGDSCFNDISPNRQAAIGSYSISHFLVPLSRASVRFGRVPPYHIYEDYAWRNPSCKMLIAALWSRSCCAPQSGQTHLRRCKSRINGF